MQNPENNPPTPAAIRPPAIDEGRRLRAVEAAYLRELRGA